MFAYPVSDAACNFAFNFAVICFFMSYPQSITVCIILTDIFVINFSGIAEL